MGNTQEIHSYQLIETEEEIKSETDRKKFQRRLKEETVYKDKNNNRYIKADHMAYSANFFYFWAVDTMTFTKDGKLYQSIIPLFKKIDDIDEYQYLNRFKYHADNTDYTEMIELYNLSISPDFIIKPKNT